MPMKTRTADFTNVKDRGQFNPIALDPGQYAAKIVAGEDGESNAGNDQTVFTIKVDGHSGTYPYYCGWDEKQMWKIRGLFEATGTEIPKKRLKINPNKLIGRPIGIELADDEYEGRIKSTIVSVFPVSEVGGEIVPEEDDDELEDDAPPARSSKAKARRKPEPEPEDDDDFEEDEGDALDEGYTEDQLAEMELEDLLDVIKERGWAKPRKPRGADDDAYADKLAEFILEQQEGADDDEPEEEPEPPKRRGRATAAAKKAPSGRSRRSEPADDDDDEDDEPAPRTRRTAAKKTAAKPATRRRSAAAAVEDDDDLDDIDLDEV